MAAKKLRRPKRAKTARPLPVPQASSREVPAHVPQPSERFAKQSSVLRKIAATDFICDPDGHSIRWHYERRDRPYAKTISWRTFEQWSLLDDWTKRRGGYWEQIEQRVREHMADEILRRRLQDLEKFERKLDAFDQFLEPLTDKDGKILLDTDGLPRYPLKMPDIDKFIAAYLKLHERVMLLRGEATTRSEQLRPLSESGGETERPLNMHLRDRAITPKLSREDARALARTMLRSRERETGAIDVESEADNADDGSDQHEELREGQAVGGHEAGG